MPAWREATHILTDLRCPACGCPFLKDIERPMDGEDEGENGPYFCCADCEYEGAADNFKLENVNDL
jgi:hypothetical protein